MVFCFHIFSVQILCLKLLLFLDSQQFCNFFSLLTVIVITIIILHSNKWLGAIHIICNALAIAKTFVNKLL